MRSYFFKNKSWFSWVYRDALWKVPTGEKVLYLTFDDGPHPEITAYVLELLENFDAKATFFCVGENVDRFPEMVSRCSHLGHTIGNHTYNHLDGWRSKKGKYLENIEQCDDALCTSGVDTCLFRPPYGNMKMSQLRALRNAGKQVVMWSHLAGDFDSSLNISASLKSMKSAHEGSILVFHDSVKACQNLKRLLPQVLDHFTTLGYSFKSLNNL